MPTGDLHRGLVAHDVDRQGLGVSEPIDQRAQIALDGASRARARARASARRSCAAPARGGAARAPAPASGPRPAGRRPPRRGTRRPRDPGSRSRHPDSAARPACAPSGRGWRTALACSPSSTRCCPRMRPARRATAHAGSPRSSGRRRLRRRPASTRARVGVDRRGRLGDRPGASAAHAHAEQHRCERAEADGDGPGASHRAGV